MNFKRLFSVLILALTFNTSFAGPGEGEGTSGFIKDMAKHAMDEDQTIEEFKYRGPIENMEYEHAYIEFLPSEFWEDQDNGGLFVNSNTIRAMVVVEGAGWVPVEGPPPFECYEDMDPEDCEEMKAEQVSYGPDKVWQTDFFVIPVTIQLDGWGLIAFARLAEENGHMTLAKIKGKKISDIFETKYKGFSIGLDIIFGANFDYVSNDKGITLKDSAGVFGGIGLEVSRTIVTIKPDLKKEEKKALKKIKFQ